jgi:hypothetical protein
MMFMLHVDLIAQQTLTSYDVFKQTKISLHRFYSIWVLINILQRSDLARFFFFGGGGWGGVGPSNPNDQTSRKFCNLKSCNYFFIIILFYIKNLKVLIKKN